LQLSWWHWKKMFDNRCKFIFKLTNKRTNRQTNSFGCRCRCRTHCKSSQNIFAVQSSWPSFVKSSNINTSLSLSFYFSLYLLYLCASPSLFFYVSVSVSLSHFYLKNSWFTFRLDRVQQTRDHDKATILVKQVLFPRQQATCKNVTYLNKPHFINNTQLLHFVWEND